MSSATETSETSETSETPAVATRAKPRRAPGRDWRSGIRSGITALRLRVSSLLAGLCLLAALSLVLGTVLVMLSANSRNGLVTFVWNMADTADLGVFSRTAGIKQFTGDGAATKNVLVNWGLGALTWLLAARLVRRVLGS